MFTRLNKAALAVVAATLLVASPAFAGGVGIINIEKIMKESKAAQSIRTQLQDKQKGFQADLDSKQKQLQAEDQSLVKQKNTLSKDAFEKKVKDFQAKAAGAEREIQTKKAALDKAFTAALKEVQDKVIGISKEIADAKDMDLVVSSSQVLYGKPSLDITDDVLKKLDASLPSVQVKI